MRRPLFIIIFIIGLGIFSYPIVSNYYSTKVHLSVVNEYREIVQTMERSEIEGERQKANEHNEKLKSSQLNFVDPFSDDNDEQNQTEGNKSYYDALNIGPAIGNINIPKINTRLPMYHGTSEKVLSRGVGHLENTSLPTGKRGTHSVLTAHRGLPSSKLFRDLDKITVGDQFFIVVLDETYAYEVFEVDIVLPHETNWLQMDDDKEIVTLLTCEPYMINTHRMLVKGERIPYELEVVASDFQTSDGKSSFLLHIVASCIALVMMTVIIIRRKRRG